MKMVQFKTNKAFYLTRELVEVIFKIIQLYGVLRRIYIFSFIKMLKFKEMKSTQKLMDLE